MYVAVTEQVKSENEVHGVDGEQVKAEKEVHGSDREHMAVTENRLS